LGHPRGARMRGRTEDPDAAAGVFDDREDVQTGAGQRDRFDEAAANSASACGRRNCDVVDAGPACRRARLLDQASACCTAPAGWVGR
jgi:hypothetical protein